ncbi:MAG: oxidoreductase C-terminal domain-containing protein [Patescibacteria group bacterium]
MYIRDGRIVGAVTINRSFERAPLTKLIMAQTPVDAIKKQLADPDTNLGELL